MIIRRVTIQDIDRIKEIHAKFYEDEFTFEDFAYRLIDAWVAVDDTDIITIGGLRPIAEAVMLTNKDYTKRSKHKIMLDMLGVMKAISHRAGFNGMHAFIQDDTWKKRLLKEGFRKTKGDCLIIDC